MPNEFRFARASIYGIAFIAVLLSAHEAGAAGNATPFGVWLTRAGDAKVHVRQCGPGICGKIVWLKQPIDSATGLPQTDDKNSDPSLKKRPVVGLPLFIGMRPLASNSWSGKIYNADDGRHYSSTITQIDPAQLEVRGCVGALCGSEIWTRVPR